MNATSARGVYATLAEHLDGERAGYTACLVQIIPKFPEPYDEMFAPHRSTEPREDIRRIDGKSFYALATGDPDALRKIYEALPYTLSEMLPVEADTLSSSPEFTEFYEQAYGGYFK